MIQDIGSYTSIGESILYGADYKRIYSVRIDLITPETAKEMLEKNINRKLNMNRVNQYVDDMKSDRWKLNGVPIIITDDGYLKDGQHRLNALIKADMSIPFVVIRYSKNFEIEANNYDIGMTRSVSDLSVLSGKGYISNRTTATMNFILRYSIKDTKPALKSVCVEEIDKNAEYLSILNEMSHSTSKGNKAAYWAAIVTAYKNGYSKEKLIEFNKVFQNGIINKLEHSPIILLRNQLLLKNRAANYKVQVDTYLRTQSALKHFESGNTKGKIYATKEFYKWEDNNNERN